MTSRRTHKQDNPEQSKRFIDTAHEVGVDESAGAFDSAFEKIDIAKAISESASVSSRRSSKKGRS
jgi:hypothetical protein